MTWRRLLPALAVLVALLVAAGAFVASAAVGGDDDTTAREPPASDRARDREPRDSLPDVRGRPSARQQAFVGLVLSEENGEVVVRDVLPRGPAARAGIEEGDVIEAVAGSAVASEADVVDIVEAREPGDELIFHIRRDGNDEDIEVRVGPRPVATGPGRERLRPLLPENEFSELFYPFPFREFLGEAYVDRLVEGALTFLNDQGEQETLRLFAGTIAEVSADRIVVTLNGGGERQFEITDDTRIVRGLRRADAQNLEQGDRALVVARDGGREAAAILGFPAREEESE